jgi:hypothetical protein
VTGQVWVVRAGEQARYVEEFEQGGYIAIGFRDLARDDLAGIGPEGLRARASNPTEHNFASQLTNFAFRIEVGDLVLVPRLPKRRDYLVGRVIGPYAHVDPDRPSGVHMRPVQWLGSFDRGALSQEAINTLGAILTVFRPSRAEAELRSLIAALTPLDMTTSADEPPVNAASTLVSGARDRNSPDDRERVLPGGQVPVIQLDVRLDGQGRAEVVCDHPALVMEQVPRHLDPSGDWGGVPGVYVLTGTELEIASVRTGLERTLTTTSIVRPWAYVGLSEDFLGRLGSHRQNKPEWRRALLVRSGATPFSSDDIKYLEREVHAVLAGTEEVRLDQMTPRGNLSARPKNPALLDACAHAVVSVLRLTGTLI